MGDHLFRPACRELGGHGGIREPAVYTEKRPLELFIRPVIHHQIVSGRVSVGPCLRIVLSAVFSLNAVPL